MQSCTWGASLSHNWMGNSLSVVPSAPMNLFLKVWIISRSTALILWLCGSTNCSVTCCRVRYALIDLVAWLLGCLVAWLIGYLVAWLLGCLVAWLLGCPSHLSLA